MENLWALIETEAAAKKIPPRQLWIWTLEAILKNPLVEKNPAHRLDVVIPNYGAGSHQSTPEYWNELFFATHKGMTNNPNVVPPSQIQDVTIDGKKFWQWLKVKLRSGRNKSAKITGPKKKHAIMLEILEELNRDFSLATDAHAAVMKVYKKKYGGMQTGRGWSYRTFCRVYNPWVEARRLSNLTI